MGCEREEVRGEGCNETQFTALGKINLAMTFRLCNIPFRNRKDVAGGRGENTISRFILLNKYTLPPDWPTQPRFSHHHHQFSFAPSEA